MGECTRVPTLHFLYMLTRLLDSDFQVSMMEKDSYLGRILTGRIHSGIIRVGDKVHGLRSSESGIVKIEDGKVCTCFLCLRLSLE